MLGGLHVLNTNHLRWLRRPRQPLGGRADPRLIEFEGPETVAAVILEPLPERRRLHPAAGRLLPAGP